MIVIDTIEEIESFIYLTLKNLCSRVYALNKANLNDVYILLVPHYVDTNYYIRGTLKGDVVFKLKSLLKILTKLVLNNYTIICTNLNKYLFNYIITNFKSTKDNLIVFKK